MIEVSIVAGRQEQSQGGPHNGGANVYAGLEGIMDYERPITVNRLNSELM